ncbi:hypothetical protein M378DRAFT_200737 [Amanita muscaria Koide BX008]|uniref:Uncharacterized protein n=1 Tax=Amanita muscaria (strain Koide BX008) TaxID=946122 RepID=A0A0C2WLQ0_AMAMK|nr:hypothetical protein M378DRAFT_200737 [Amanita muscaria Koide BX008]
MVGRKTRVYARPSSTFLKRSTLWSLLCPTKPVTDFRLSRRVSYTSTFHPQSTRVRQRGMRMNSFWWTKIRMPRKGKDEQMWGRRL